MKNLNSFVIIICAVALLGVSCAPKSMLLSKNLNKKHWINGAWKLDKSTTVEEWTFKSKKSMTAKVYSAVKGDTLLVEALKLEKQGKDLFYTVSIMEPGKKPFTMKLKTENEKEIIFENVKDEFPKLITYTLTGPKQMMARVEGYREDGDFHVKEFIYSR